MRCGMGFRTAFRFRIPVLKGGPSMESSADIPGAGGIYIGPFAYDEAAGCLRVGGREILLRPKVASLLRVLVGHGGGFVAGEDVYRAVWGDTAVTPNAVTNVVGELRRILEQEAGLGNCVETIPRRGYRFTGPLRVEQPARVAAAAAGFVGREPELAALRSAFADAGRGRRRAVFINGEAGGGKTTLVGQFVAALDGAVVAAGHCPEDGSESYAPVLQLLAELGSGPLALELGMRLRRDAPAWSVHLPGLCTTEEQRATARSLIGDGPGRMLREAVVLLEGLARERTVVLVLEDLHRADAPTVELVTALCRGTAATRLLVVGTYRSVDALVHRHPVVAAVAALRRHAAVDVLPIAPFSVGEVGRCLELEFADATIARRLAEPIAMHCGGNPLYVKTVCEQLRRDGWVRAGDAGLEVAADLDRFVPRLPEDLHALIELQLSALPDDSVRLLEAVSVIGEEATAAVIAAALGESPQRVVDFGHDLVRHGVYLKLLPGTRGATYAFTHALYQRGVYNRMTPSLRARLHALVGAHLGAALAAASGEGSLRVARHFEAAGDRAGAAIHRERAGILALQRFDHEQALDSLQRALEHLEAVPPAADHDLRRSRLQLALANALTHLHGFTHPSVGEAFARAETHAVAAGAAHERIRALLGASSVPLAAGCPRAAEPLIDRLLAAIEEGPVSMRFYAWCRAARLATVTGRFADARELLERGEGLPVEPGIPLHVDAVAEAEGWKAIVLANLGYPTAARAAVDRAVARAEEAGLPWGYAGVLAIVRHAALLERDDALAAEIARRSDDHCRRHDLPIYAMLDRLFALYGDGARSPTKATAAAFERLLGEVSHIGEVGNASFHWVLLAELQLRAGELDAAGRATDAALAASDAGGEAHSLAEVWRLRGEVLAARGGGSRRTARSVDDDAAVAALRRAVAIARSQSAALLEVRAAASLANRLAACGARDAAVAELAAACERFPEPQGSPAVLAALTQLEQLRAAGKKAAGRRRPR